MRRSPATGSSAGTVASGPTTAASGPPAAVRCSAAPSAPEAADGLRVVAVDDLGDAGGLGRALALEGERHRHLGAPGDVVDRVELRAEPQLGADGHGRREA